MLAALWSRRAALFGGAAFAQQQRPSRSAPAAPAASIIRSAAAWRTCCRRTCRACGDRARHRRLGRQSQADRLQQSEVALVMADAALDALKGEDKFKGNKVDVRTLMVLYPNRMHVVTIEGNGIEKMSDLKGKRVSTGSPGSATEVMAFRVIEAAGLDKDKDMKRERLGVAESTNAIKDGKIDAYFWVGGLPTAAVTDLGATPGREDQADRSRRSGRQDERQVRRHLYAPASSRPRPIRARTRTTRSPWCRTSWSPTPGCRTRSPTTSSRPSSRRRPIWSPCTAKPKAIDLENQVRRTRRSRGIRARRSTSPKKA